MTVKKIEIWLLRKLKFVWIKSFFDFIIKFSFKGSTQILNWEDLNDSKTDSQSFICFLLPNPKEAKTGEETGRRFDPLKPRFVWMLYNQRISLKVHGCIVYFVIFHSIPVWLDYNVFAIFFLISSPYSYTLINLRRGKHGKCFAKFLLNKYFWEFLVKLQRRGYFSSIRGQINSRLSLLEYILWWKI